MQLAWSHSRLKHRRQCMRKLFYYAYAPKHLRIKPKPNAKMEEGRKLHKKLEDAVHSTIKFGDRANFDPKIEHVRPMISAFVKAYATIETELQIAFREDLTETDWFAHDVWVRVVFDLVGLNHTHAAIIDWKTGKVAVDDQLELFAAAGFTKWPQLQVIDTGYAFTAHSQSETRRYTRDDMNFIWHKFGEEFELIKIANDAGDWPAKQGPLCGWCDVPRQLCEFATVG